MEGLERMAVAVNRLKAGSKAPDFAFESPWNKGLKLSDFASRGPVFLWFMRYYGCTLCQLDIRNLARNYKAFSDKGASVIVVLQSDPAKIRGLVGKADLPFTIACDPAQELFKRYEVRPAVSQAELMSLGTIKKIGEAMMAGIRHGDYEGVEFQLPALFLLGPGLEIRWAKYAKNLADLPSVQEMASLLDVETKEAGR